MCLGTLKRYLLLGFQHQQKSYHCLLSNYFRYLANLNIFLDCISCLLKVSYYNKSNYLTLQKHHCKYILSSILAIYTLKFRSTSIIWVIKLLLPNLLVHANLLPHLLLPLKKYYLYFQIFLWK